MNVGFWLLTLLHLLKRIFRNLVQSDQHFLCSLPQVENNVVLSMISKDESVHSLSSRSILFTWRNELFKNSRATRCNWTTYRRAMAWLRELGEPWIILKRNWHLIYPSISVYRDWVVGRWKDNITGRRKKYENGVKCRHSWKAGSHIRLEQTFANSYHSWSPLIIFFQYVSTLCVLIYLILFFRLIFKKLNIFKKRTSYQHVVENPYNEILSPQVTRNCPYWWSRVILKRFLS